MKILPYSGATVTQKMLLPLWKKGIVSLYPPVTEASKKSNLCLPFLSSFSQGCDSRFRIKKPFYIFKLFKFKLFCSQCQGQYTEIRHGLKLE